MRNVAIVAHVDHGKTTLVDAMLWQSGAFRANQDVDERVMDSMDLEREKGITILAKNTAVQLRRRRSSTSSTRPATPTSAARSSAALTMVDGVLLLVDASEGPLPQTRFVLRKALEARLPVILVVNKVDRPDARIAEVVDEVYELFLDLDADEDQIEFPIVYTNAKAGWASLDPGDAGRETSSRCSTCCVEHIPAPELRPRAPAAGAGHEPRRLALPRPPRDLPRAPRRRSARASRSPGAAPTARSQRATVTELYVTEALDRVEADEAGPGRDHRRRRPGRRDDRRDARRPRRPARRCR